jgi:hypothetical protein
MAFTVQIGSPNDALQRAKKFQLPQFKSPSSQVNQANSEVMQQGTSSPDSSTATGDLYSGAKQGVERIKTGIADQTQGIDAGAAFGRGQEMVNDASALATEKAAPQESPTPETLVGKPQTGINTGLVKSQGLTDEAARVARNAQNPNSPDLDALRQAQIKQAQAENALGGFDPTKQPVSKLRKTAAIASGLATGILGHGGVQGGIKQYQAIARQPALEQQQQLARKAQAAGVNVGTAEKTAGVADKLMNTQNDVSKNIADLAKIQEANDIYVDTGRNKNLAETANSNAQAASANAEAIVKGRPPKPEIVNTPVGDKSSAIELDPKTNNWNIRPLNDPGDKGIQKLSATEEPIVRGWLSTKGHDPNETMKGYMNGDPASSALVYQALHDEAISRNPAMIFQANQLIPTYDAMQKPTGAILFNSKDGSMTPKTLAEMGMDENGYIKTPPKSLDATSNSQFRGAINTKKVVSDINDQLFPSSTDPTVQAKATKLRERLGAASGRISETGVDLIGLKDPEVADLLTKLQSAAVFAVQQHTGRTTPAFVEEFKKTLGGIKQAPENLKARMKVMLDVADDVRGTIESTNPNASQVASQKASELAEKGIVVGNVVTHKDKTKWKITKVHPDGTYDADQVKQ